MVVAFSVPIFYAYRSRVYEKPKAIVKVNVVLGDKYGSGSCGCRVDIYPCGNRKGQCEIIVHISQVNVIIHAVELERSPGSRHICLRNTVEAMRNDQGSEIKGFHWYIHK